LTLSLAEVGRDAVALVGGKGANLGELIRAGFQVPEGFCVTTAAYAQVAAGAGLEPILRDLARTKPEDQRRLAALAAQAHDALRHAAVPNPVESAIRDAYAALCLESGDVAVAVRSSATAEDLLEASFAGQQDTFLGIAGSDAVVDAVRRCWASLWTERAVAYRAANRIDLASVRLCAVVQRMVPAQAAGVLFTADPVSGRRRRSVIDAVRGLGEALVSGHANPDHFVVDLDSMDVSGPTRDGCLDVEEARSLARIGAQVEAHYSQPQDIEFAVDGERRLWLLQARPITTLFPLPASADGGGLRVYVNLNVLQGVFQPLTPMGIDLFRRIATAGAALLGYEVDPARGPALLTPLAGRLFLDATPILTDETGRRIALAVLGVMEPLTGGILRQVTADPRLERPRKASRLRLAARLLGVMRRAEVPPRVLGALINPERTRRKAYADVEGVLAGIEEVEGAREALDRAEWLALQIPRRLFARVLPPAALGIFSLSLARRVARKAGVEEDAMAATRGLPHNLTTEMNLDLWARAQRMRAAGAERLLEETPPATLAARYQAGKLPVPVKEEMAGFLRRYGFRGVAEIDAGVARWEEDPTHVFGALANMLRLRDPDLAPDVQFRRAAESAEESMRRAVAQAGPLHAAMLRVLFGRVRALGGMRESPKFYAVAALSHCRRLLLRAGRALEEAGRIRKADDILFLTFAEAREALDGKDQRGLVAARRAEHVREWGRRRLPRVLLSDGTSLYGEASPIPGGGSSLTGSAASPGVYSGKARVVLEPSGARLDPGEVLVAPFTDPGWTPLFMTAGALVMEMGGMMSHGSIVAREYGIPAVVGVPAATTVIRTGQRVTVDGTKGQVLLDTQED
jgi:pyruvate,water dikinase